MASNEEILKRIHAEKVINWNQIFRQNPTIIESAYEAMDAARRDEVIEILKWLTSEDSPYAVCNGSDTPFATIGDDYTIEQLYTIFKKNS